MLMKQHVNEKDTLWKLLIKQSVDEITRLQTDKLMKQQINNLIKNKPTKIASVSKR
jgi:hypothetical protein